MTEYVADPIIWFADRQLEYPPAHFVKATTPLISESKQWVLNHLIGRFSIVNDLPDMFMLQSGGIISFEDPGDAMLYELRWS